MIVTSAVSPDIWPVIVPKEEVVVVAEVARNATIVGGSVELSFLVITPFNLGHISRECTESRSGDRGRGSACYNCGESGHMARDCTQARQQVRSLDLRFMLMSLFSQTVVAEAIVIIVANLVISRVNAHRRMAGVVVTSKLTRSIRA